MPTVKTEATTLTREQRAIEAVEAAARFLRTASICSDLELRLQAYELASERMTWASEEMVRILEAESEALTEQRKLF